MYPQQGKYYTAMEKIIEFAIKCGAGLISTAVNEVGRKFIHHWVFINIALCRSWINSSKIKDKNKYLYVLNCKEFLFNSCFNKRFFFISYKITQNQIKFCILILQSLH